MTAAEIRADAVALIRKLEGLDQKPPTTWTYEERVKYNARLAEYIASRPGDFTQSEINVAEWVAASPYQPLEDTSFDWGMFATESVRPVGEAAQAVGDGVFSVLRSARWAIPVLAVAGLIVFAETATGGKAIASLKKLFK